MCCFDLQGPSIGSDVHNNIITRRHTLLPLTIQAIIVRGKSQYDNWPSTIGPMRTR